MRKKIVVWSIVCAFLALEVAPLSYAQTSVTGPGGPASASVPQFLEFSLKTVKKMTSATFNPLISPFDQGTDVSLSPSFDFGNLTSVTDTNPLSLTFGQFLYMRGQFFYYVLMVASTSGRKYMITEKGTQLSGPGGAKIANESVLLVPDYQWLDTLGGVAQLAPPSGASVGPVTAATSTTGATQSLVYQSDLGGLGRVVRAVVGIGGPAAGTTYPTNTSLGTNGTSPQGTPQSFTAWKAITPDQVSGSYSGTVTFTLTLN
ncbi:MAG: hypothetical protein AAB213_04430 [Candidatus Omnitrophota bacterium]